MAVSVQSNSWVALSVGRGLTVRWSSNEECISVFTVCFWWAMEAREKHFCWHSGSWSFPATSDVVSPWKKKIPVIFNLFLSLVTKILESMIPGSKSNKSYEFLHCVTVLVKSWSWQSHLTLSRWPVWIMWVTGFLFYFDCVLGATKGAVFLLPCL